ncbi:MAG: hypothetical protein AAB210_00630, partial [Deltaproteobacteria bacterium]
MAIAILERDIKAKKEIAIVIGAGKLALQFAKQREMFLQHVRQQQIYSSMAAGNLLLSRVAKSAIEGLTRAEEIRKSAVIVEHKVMMERLNANLMFSNLQQQQYYESPKPFLQMPSYVETPRKNFLTGEHILFPTKVIKD